MCSVNGLEPVLYRNFPNRLWPRIGMLRRQTGSEFAAADYIYAEMEHFWLLSVDSLGLAPLVATFAILCTWKSLAPVSAIHSPPRVTLGLYSLCTGSAFLSYSLRRVNLDL